MLEVSSVSCIIYVKHYLKYKFSGTFAISGMIRFALTSLNSYYVTVCVLCEHASVSDCRQDIDGVSNPEALLLAWVVCSLVFSVLFFVIFGCHWKVLKFQKQKAIKMYKNDSFVSLLLLLLMTIGYYIFRALIAPSGLGKAIAGMLCLWLFVTVGVLWNFNFTPRVRLTKDSSWTRRKLVGKNALFFFCWSALLIYFFEALAFWLAVALDVAHQVAPLIEKRFHAGESWQFRGGVVFLIGLGLAFHSKLLSFYCTKIFHGDSNHYSEPGEKLDDTPTLSNTGSPPEDTSRPSVPQPNPLRNAFHQHQLKHE